MILLLIKAPTGLSLDVPETGATPEQIAVGQAIEAIHAEWMQPVGVSGADLLWRVLTRGTDLTSVEALITQYSLPLTIMHSQDAYETVQGTEIINGMEVPIMGVTVHKQGIAADILPFMPDFVVYDMDGVELTRTVATTITLPNCSDMGAWQL